MSIHAANTAHTPGEGECTRQWPQSFGQFLYCTAPTEPGEDVCRAHLIERKQAARLTLITPAAPYSSDRCWIYTRAYGWLPNPGTRPLKPRRDHPLRTLPPEPAYQGAQR